MTNHPDPNLVPMTVMLPKDLAQAVHQLAIQQQCQPDTLMVRLLQAGLAAALQADASTGQSNHPGQATMPSGGLPNARHQPAVDTPLTNCPQCQARLGAPLQSSGRRVCSQCGWSDRRRQAGSDASSSNHRSLETNLENKIAAPSPAQPQPQRRLPANPDVSGNAVDGDDTDLYRILAQAADESRSNMKPRTSQKQGQKKSLRDFLR
jgi:hypothetical protein